MNVRSFIFIISVLFLACKPTKTIEDPLLHVLSSEQPEIKRVIDSLEQFEVQIRYTQINRTEQGVTFKDYDFQVNDNQYFYPASTVKFPIAVLALEKLNDLNSIQINTRFYIEGDSVETTFSKTISEIFAVSDNDANNRLVEFMGQDYINSTLKAKKIAPVRIAHRLGYHSEDLATKPLIIYENDSTTTQLPSTINTAPEQLNLDKITKGKGYYDEENLIEEPFDFSFKNYYPISTQHEVLKRVIFPDAFEMSEQFHLSEEQNSALLKAMHTVPRKVGYDPKTYYDGYCKFFMYGDTKENIPDHIEIYNKVGFAYGTLTDCAYIKDSKNQVDFLITATILVNKNGIFNDNDYDYEKVGIPFLAELGRQLYQLELSRKK